MKTNTNVEATDTASLHANLQSTMVELGADEKVIKWIDSGVTRDFALHCALSMVCADNVKADAQAEGKKATTSVQAYLLTLVRDSNPVQALASFKADVISALAAGGIKPRPGKEKGTLATPMALEASFSMARTVIASPWFETARAEVSLRKAYDYCRAMKAASEAEEARRVSEERARQAEQAEQEKASERQQQAEREQAEQAEQAEAAKAAAILDGSHARKLAERIQALNDQIKALQDEADALNILGQVHEALVVAKPAKSKRKAA